MHRAWILGLCSVTLLLSSGCPKETGTPDGNVDARHGRDIHDDANDNATDIPSGAADANRGGKRNRMVNTNTNPNTSANAAPATPAPEMFTTAANCAACHNNLTDAGGNDVSLGTAWRGTMMANAARDPYFTAKVSAEIARLPHLAEIIEDTCARCHMPMARTQLAADGKSAVIFGDDGLLHADHPLHNIAIDGVSCVLCHQIEDEKLGEPESFSGGFVIDTTTAKSDRVNYGPYDDSKSAALMQMTSGYVPVQGTHLAEAALCATCHTLYTPYVNANGELADDLFPEQTAFLEWRHSEFGDGDGQNDQTCQQCHLPDADDPAPIASVPANLPARAPFSQHHFVGGNAFMVAMMKNHREAIGAAASSADFDAVIARTLAQLQERTADLSIASAAVDGDTLNVVVRVENRAGHKLPTGFPARRAWLHFRVTDASGAVIFDSGAPQADGAIAGVNSDTDITTFEPHHTRITSPDQAQVYQSIMKNTEGEVTHTLLRAAGYAKDNRLLPAGFDKASAGADFAVVGAAVEDADFVGGSDDTTFSVPLADAPRPMTVTVDLLYQSVAQPFVADLRDVETEPVRQFLGFIDAADHTPVRIATATHVVE